MIRAGRRHARIEMGEAINFEDVLTVMMVLILLRLIFMIPLVNLDKAKTVAARSDAYWEREALWVHSHAGGDSAAAAYRTAFELKGYKTLRTDEAGDVWLEAASADSSLLVIRHQPATGRFAAMQVDGRGHSLSFRHGSLLWSRSESEWFAASDSLDYGARAESRAMEKDFREWTKAKRGY